MRGLPRTMVCYLGCDIYDAILCGVYAALRYGTSYGVAYMRHCTSNGVAYVMWDLVHHMVWYMLCEAWYIRWCGVAPNYDCSYAVGGSRGQMAVRGVKIFIQKPASFGFVSDMVANHGVLFQFRECIILSLYLFMTKNICFLAISLAELGVTPPPPLNIKSFGPKKLIFIGGIPPP